MKALFFALAALGVAVTLLPDPPSWPSWGTSFMWYMIGFCIGSGIFCTEEQQQ